MQEKLPPEVVNNIIEVVYYFVAGAIGWLAKWLQGKSRDKPKAG